MPQIKTILDENEIPKQWYNILPDLPKPLPPPVEPETMAPGPGIAPKVFAKAVLEQEFSKDRWIDIPEEIREVYRIWRPTPLYRAIRLEKALKTPARIYYKYEGVSPAGSHKPNTAVAQAYYNMKEGVERLTTETGAGQWGSALAFAANVFGLKSTIYMVSASYKQKPYRKSLMELWGGEVYSSPSKQTKTGRKFLEENPDSTGSLGLAISEAVEDALENKDANYAIGSVFNHVLMHQTIIGLETKKQLDSIEEYPDNIIGCIGGGSSFAGIFYPFYYDKVSKKAPKDTCFTAIEPTACPSITKGPYTYDHGDAAGLTPLFKMNTLGHDFIPPPIHAGGLRYHGKAPTMCLLSQEKEMETRAYNQVEVFDAAKLFARTEGIVPAPEPAHAIKAVVDEAIKCRKTGEEKSILFLLCGHGFFDMQAYDDYFHGKLEPCDYPEAEIAKSIDRLKNMYPWVQNLPF